MDINKLTMGEVAKVEALAGVGISALGDEDSPKGTLLAALAFVVKKRENPKYTFEDALNLTMDEVTDILGLDEDEEDPKDKK